jgi:hypothetical protein
MMIDEELYPDDDDPCVYQMDHDEDKLSDTEGDYKYNLYQDWDDSGHGRGDFA